MPLQKNQLLTLRIERLSNDGSGGAHSSEGEAVFVPGTAPGDEAQVRIVKDCGRYAFGILDKLLTPSPDRIPVDCAVAGPCGGCSLRHLDYAAARGRSPAKTLAMWDRVLDGETRYIKGFKTTADFLLDTSFTYELGLIAKLLRKVCQRFTLEGHNAELWDETARRFEHVAPVELDLLPADSMLREFYAGEL